MTREEANKIKKALYKEKPTAVKIAQPKNERFLYEAETSLGKVRFDVPINEMGETFFEREMPAQLLIRWLVK